MFINPVADLEVMQAAPVSVPVTTEFTYSMSVTNRGPNGTSGTVLSHALSASSAFVASSASQGECSHSEGTVRCRIGALLVGESATVEVTVKAGGLGPLQSSATVIGDAEDPDVSNNVAQSETTPVLAPGVPSARVWGIVLLALLLGVVLAIRTRRWAAKSKPSSV